MSDFNGLIYLNSHLMQLYHFPHDNWNASEREFITYQTLQKFIKINLKSFSSVSVLIFLKIIYDLINNPF